MRKKRYTVACLSGDGIGPEVMAEASRALANVSQLHGFSIDELHVPFGGDAVRRFGHALPQATRAACHVADAVLVATTKEPALEGVKAELDLTWRMTRVRASDTRLTVVSPLADDADEVAVDGAFDVIVSEQAFAEALSHTAAYAHGTTRMVASGRLSERSAGIFGPTHGSADEIAGQGVANPSGMLLAAALMLEGLGERTAARTLENAVAETLGTGVRTPDLVSSGIGATTREFMEVLLAALPGARTDTEFAGVAA